MVNCPIRVWVPAFEFVSNLLSFALWVSTKNIASVKNWKGHRGLSPKPISAFDLMVTHMHWPFVKSSVGQYLIHIIGEILKANVLILLSIMSTCHWWRPPSITSEYKWLASVKSPNTSEPQHIRRSTRQGRYSKDTHLRHKDTSGELYKRAPCFLTKGSWRIH